jgi:caffeoyl-CoA O-methyltransferase
VAREVTYDQIQDYLESLVPPRPAEMEAMEAHARDIGFPIVGPASGFICYLMARMIRARHVFEMGSGYGYSTSWFAKAVQENGGGKVHHVVWNEELSRQAQAHLAALGFEETVEYHVSEALQLLEEMPGPFDLIFNDINKHAYPASLPVISEKLRPGGVLIVDNMLWHGQVFDEGDWSPDTRGVRELTRLISTDSGWIASIVPIRDGLLVAYKK